MYELLTPEGLKRTSYRSEIYKLVPMSFTGIVGGCNIPKKANLAQVRIYPFFC